MACLELVEAVVLYYRGNTTQPIFPFCNIIDGAVLNAEATNDPNDISQAQMLSILLLGCLGSIFFFMGVTTNLASAYYLRTIRHRLPLHNYLVSLLLWDSAQLLIT